MIHLRSKGYSPTLWEDIDFIYRALLRIYGRMLKHPEQFGIPPRIKTRWKKRIKRESTPQVTESLSDPITNARNKITELNRKYDEWFKTYSYDEQVTCDHGEVKTVRNKVTLRSNSSMKSFMDLRGECFYVIGENGKDEKRLSKAESIKKLNQDMLERITMKIDMAYGYCQQVKNLWDYYFKLSKHKVIEKDQNGNEVEKEKSRGFIPSNVLPLEAQIEIEILMRHMLYGSCINIMEWSIRDLYQGNIPEYVSKSIRYLIKDIISDVELTKHQFDAMRLPNVKMMTVSECINFIKDSHNNLSKSVEKTVNTFRRVYGEQAHRNRFNNWKSLWNASKLACANEDDFLREAQIQGELVGFDFEEHPLPRDLRNIGRNRDENGDRIVPTFYADVDFMNGTIDENKYVREIRIITEKSTKNFIETSKKKTKKRSTLETVYHHHNDVAVEIENMNVINDYMGVSSAAIVDNLSINFDEITSELDEF